MFSWMLDNARWSWSCYLCYIHFHKNFFFTSSLWCLVTPSLPPSIYKESWHLNFLLKISYSFRKKIRDRTRWYKKKLNPKTITLMLHGVAFSLFTTFFCIKKLEIILFNNRVFALSINPGDSVNFFQIGLLIYWIIKVCPFEPSPCT